MATPSAIAAVSQAIVASLEQAAARPGCEFAGLPVDLVHGRDLAAGMPGGISVYLHQVSPAAAPPNLSPPQRAGALPPVAVELHYLLTAWGDTPAVQQRLLGWCLRSLHDVPVLVASALNIAGGDAEIFHPDETVELVWEPSGAWPLGDTGPASLNLPPSLRFRARSVAIDQVPPG